MYLDVFNNIIKSHTILYVYNAWNRQIHRDRRGIPGCQESGWGEREWLLEDVEFLFGVMTLFWN